MRLLTVFLVIPIVVTLLLAPCGFAQSINLGLKMGARLTSEVKDSVLNQSFPESQQNSSITDASRLIAFGPTIQVQLPSELALKQVRYIQALSRSVCWSTWRSAASSCHSANPAVESWFGCFRRRWTEERILSAFAGTSIYAMEQKDLRRTWFSTGDKPQSNRYVFGNRVVESGPMRIAWVGLSARAIPTEIRARF